jgi:hypothetical protein
MDEIYDTVNEDAPHLPSVDERRWAVVARAKAAMEAGAYTDDRTPVEQSAYDAIDLRDCADQMYRPAIKRTAAGLIEADRAYLLSLPELDDRVREILEHRLY